MYILINREKLLQPLTFINNIVQRKQTMSILANVLLKIDNNRLWLIGTDLEVEAAIYVDNVETKQSGTCTVTAQKLLDITKALPDESVLSIHNEKSKMYIHCGKSRFTLQALPSEKFPRIETDTWPEKFKIQQSPLKLLIEATSFSMAQQDVRYYLNGLLFEIDQNNLISVATDGHRLSKAQTVIDNSNNTESLQAIIPRKAIMELNRLLGKNESLVTVELNNHHIRFTFDDIIFTSKLIDGNFPDYKDVISIQLPIRLDLDRDIFYQTLYRASILTSDKFRGIRLTLEADKLSVVSNNPEQELASDEMPIEGYDGDKLEIGFNVYYLIDILKNIDTQAVSFNIKDSNSSCIISKPDDDNNKYLVMPMRL